MNSSRKRILVTNDDGYDAPGLHALVGAMEELGEVIVAAPDREQSGSAHALTLERPLRVFEVKPGHYRIDGTPTDCVHLAIHGLTGDDLPDLVASGINRGLNVGDDLTYSGTVAGALEGALLHIPAIAVSAALNNQGNAAYETAARVALEIGRDVIDRGLDPGLLLNVNVPDGEIAGQRITRQGTRAYRATAERRLDPAGRPYYWIAGVDMTPSGESDGDHRAVSDGFISITPLHANLTHEPSLEPLRSWGLER